jgi:hypothetical protein
LFLVFSAHRGLVEGFPADRINTPPYLAR